MYAVLVAVRLRVNASMVGGNTGIEVKEPGSPWDSGPVVTGREGGVGWYHYPANNLAPIVVGPGAEVRLVQSSALLSGSATINAEFLIV